MTPAARLAAAIEVLTDILERHRPAADALADWGKAHRFAGSGDRGAIGNLTHDALRRRASLAARLGDDSPRALVLALTAFHWETPEAAIRHFSGEGHAPAALTEAERAALLAPKPEMTAAQAGDYPAWADPYLARVFGEGRAAELSAMAERAPLDLRVNTLKADRAKVLRDLEGMGATPGGIAPTCVRIPAGTGPRRSPNVEVEPAFQKGWVELQDEGSQIAALLAGAAPGEQVADLCAGGGGKTLALAATMENSGQLYAWDSDKHRLAPIFQRLERAGARNAQVKRAGDRTALDAMKGKLDRVVLDVPCTGTGAWRRRPDAKWRLKEGALELRIKEQDSILQDGAACLRPGGALVYITCSLLAEENEDRIAAFLATRVGGRFSVVDLKPRWRALFGSAPPAPPPGVSDDSAGLRLSTRSTGTDGFFVAMLRAG